MVDPDQCVQFTRNARTRKNGIGYLLQHLDDRGLGWRQHRDPHAADDPD